LLHSCRLGLALLVVLADVPLSEDLLVPFLYQLVTPEEHLPIPELTEGIQICRRDHHLAIVEALKGDGNEDQETKDDEAARTVMHEVAEAAGLPACVDFALHRSLSVVRLI